MDRNVGLVAVDHAVVAMSLLAPLGIGILFAIKDRKNSTREEYLMGNRKLSLIPVTLSLFVTFQSSVSLLGIPGDFYMFGAMICVFYVGVCLSYIIGYFFMIPVVYPLKLTSMHEYFYLRYECQAMRKMTAIMGMTQTAFFLSIVLLAPALALQATLSIPLWMSVIIIGVTCTVYTAIGGIKSVVWSDTFQTILLFVGMFTVIVKGSMVVGGLTEAVGIARAGGRLSFDQFGPDPRLRHTWGGVVIGQMFLWLTNIFNQSSVQRICSMKTEKAAKISFLMNIPINLLYGTILLLMSIVMYAYFDKFQCDPLKAGLIANRNQVMPFYIVHAMQDIPGISGVYMATLFSGSLSTLSSGINALSACTIEDILQNRLKSLQERTITLVTKTIVVIYGIVIVSLAYGASFVKGNVVQLASFVMTALGCPIVGMFMVGSIVPWANKYGAVVGGVVTSVTSMFLTVMSVLYGRKPVQLPSPSIAGCFSNNISSTVGEIGHSFLSHSNQTLPDHVNYRPGINHTSAAFTTETILIFNTTPPSSQDANTRSPHDFGFFLFDISYEWGSVVGLTVFLVVSLTVSWVTRGKIKNPPAPQLLVPCSRRAVLMLHASQKNDGQEDSEPKVSRSTQNYSYSAVPNKDQPDLDDLEMLGQVKQTQQFLMM